jgi:hypothetical protein
MSPRRIPREQVGFFVGISSINQCMVYSEGTSLMSIMAMASHGRRVSLLSRCFAC